MSEKSSAHPPAAERPPARLCYVDDSRTAAFVMRRMLEPGGYQVDYFQSAEPAIVALIQGDYDLLLTDLKVSSSGMDGDDLIRTLRQSGQPRLSQLPIIVITGSTDAEVLVKAYDAGANQVMTKPVDAEALHSHIRRLLFEGHESVQAEPPAARREPETVPLVTAIQPPPPPAGKDEKVIPVLQVAPAPAEARAAGAEAMRPSSEAAAPVAKTPSTGPGENEPLSMIERAVAGHAQPSPASHASAAPASGVEAPRPVAAEQGAEQQDRQDMPNRKSPSRVEESDEVGNNDDYEASPGRQWHREGGPRETGQHVFEGASLPFFSRLRRLFSGATLPLLMVLAVLGFVAFAGWRFYFDQGLAVQTTFAETGEIYQSIVVSGQVVSRRQVTIRAAHPGRLVTVPVQTGDKVRIGQLLARLDEQALIAQLEEAQAELAGAREDIMRAEQTWESLRRAHEKGAVAEQFVKDAEVRLRAARARASVVMREARDTSQALKRQSITAPFSGTILRRHAEVGQWVTPADALFVLADETQHEIEIQVDADDGKHILAGQVVLITSDAIPGREWKERVVRLDAAPDQAASAGPLRVFVSLGAEAPDLRLGQVVDAEIRTAWSPHAIKVPFEALLKREGQVYLAVLQDGRVRMKPVITGIEDFTMVEIRQGLEGQEEIILPRGHMLHEGDRVYRTGTRE